MARYANKNKKEEEKKKQQSVSARAMRNDKARQANADKTVKSSKPSSGKTNKQTTVKKSANRSSRTMGNNKGLFANSRLFDNKKNEKKSTTSKRGSALSNISDKLYGDNDRVNRNSGTQKKTTQNKLKAKKNAVTGVQTRSSKDARSDKLKNLTQGNMRQIIASHAKTLSAVMPSENPEDYETRFKGKYSHIVQKPKYENHKGIVNAKGEISDWATKQIEKSQKEIKNGKKDLGKVGGLMADAYGAALGVVSDAAAGPLAPISMFSRSMGSAYNTAEQEGASHNQAMLYGATKGTVEAATEKLGLLARPLQKLYGKGVTDDFAERVIRKVAERAKTVKGKDVIETSGKLTAMLATEALEEMIAEGLDPAIANQIYADQVGYPLADGLQTAHHDFSMKEVGRAGLIGALTGGMVGGGALAVEQMQGANVREIYGENGMKTLADFVKESDDDADALTGAALGQMINEGGGIAAGQALQLKRAFEKQNEKDRTKLQDLNRATDEVMRKEGLVNFLKKIDENGNLDLTDSAREVYEGAKQKATEIADVIVPKDGQNQLKDMTVDKITSEVASIVTGAVMDIDTVNTFTTGNTLARQIYEQTTGETLPATNRETREYLYNQIAKNRHTSLKAETALQMDRFKGNVIQRMTTTYGAKGQSQFETVIGNVDVRNQKMLDDALVTFENYYEAGRQGITLQEMAGPKMYNPAYDILPPEAKTAAWKAGEADGIGARNLVAGRAKDIQLALGQKISESQPQANSVAPRGKVIHEFQDAENAMRFTASQNTFYQKMAETFNINIHITDNPDYNGNYQNGEVWMSVDADRDLSYVFAHEITHHLQQYAPQEYEDYKELVRSAWGVEELNAAIRAKIAHYAQHNVNLSREDAFDEIVADATYEMVQDPAFVNELRNEDRTLAKQILDALRNMIKKIRAMLAGEKKFTPAQNEGLLSQLDILKEAERLWEIGLKKAEENRDAVGVIENDGGVKYSMAKPFEQQLDDVIKNKHNPNYDLWVMNTPEALIKAGLPEGPLLMRNGKVKDVLNKHPEMSMGILEQIPQAVENPILVIKSKTNPDKSVVVISEIMTTKGELVVPIWVEQEATFVDVEGITHHGYENFVASAYGRNVKSLLEYALENEGIYYVNEDNKKVGKLLALYGLQLSDPLKVSNFNYIISETSENSNKKFSLNDSEYMAAVESGDMETAQRMVDEAAEQAGYTVRLLHGTQKFGFTVPDTEKSDDKLSFFATNDIVTAQTYSSLNGKRGISEEVDDASIDEGIYAHEETARENAYNLADTISQWAGYYGFVDGDYIHENFSEIAEDFEAEEANNRMYEFATDIIEHGYSEEDYDGQEFWEWQESEEADLIFAKVNKVINSYLSRAQFEEKAELSGNYDLYANTDGLLVIDGKGANWNTIDVENLPDITSPEYEKYGYRGNRYYWTTRSISKYAKDNGYRGVLFKNITDDGGRGISYVEKPADVYSFFYPQEQVKSADPVTYDDEGNVIPLSERFNSKNEDIRYSLKDSEGRELSPGQQEYFKDSKVRDENGNLLVMYHGTDSYEEFNVFKSGKSGYLGKGMYFSDSEAYAKRYATKNGYDGRIYKVYLNVKNPLVVTSENPAVEILGEKLAARREKSNSFSTTWIKPSDIKKLVDKGYDGIIWKYGATIEVSVWNSNQIKNIDNESPTTNPDIRFSFKDSNEANDKAINHFGETGSWEETGYLLTDGRRLDFSGRHWGGSGGNREVDHRDVHEAFEDQFDDGVEAMVAFMGIGNIRVSPESGGLNIAKMPTPQQLEMLEDYIEAFDGEVVLDIDNGEGRTVNGTEYPAGTPASKVLNDIKGYFRTGKAPVVSEMTKFRYSFKDDINVSVDDVNEYVNAHPEEFAEVMQYFYSEQQAHHTRQKTMQELQSQLEKMKVDKKLTHGRVLDPKSIEEDANSLVRMMLSYKEENTKLTDYKLKNMIQANAKEIFTYLKDGDQESAIMTAYHAAEELVHNLNMANDEMYHTYKELRDYLRNTRVYIPNEYLGDFPDLAEFRTRQMGRIRLVNEESGGKSVDTMYEELLEMFPGMFDETLDNPADQMYEIRDVRETLDPYEIVLSHEETEQLIKEAAHDILELAVNGKPWKSWADRNKEVYDEKIRALKQKHQEAVRDVRLKEKERAEKKIEAVRAKADEGLQQAKEKGEQKLQEEKQKNKERQQNQRDQRKKRETIAKMEKQISWLSDRLLKPTDDKHLPEGYQKAIAQLLYSIDTQTERSKKLEEKYGLSKKRLKFLELKDQYEKIAAQADSDILLDEDIANELSTLAELLEDQPISEASPAQLEQIYKVLRNITHGIRMVNQAFVEGQKATISEMAEETIETAQKKKQHNDRTGMIGGLDSILNESMVTPRDFFERIGGGVEQAYIGIRKGFDKHVDNITTARTFFEGMFKKYYNKKKPGSALEKWRDNSTNETFQLEQGGEITLNVAQRMSLYCLMKREQAQSHILGSGIVATEVDINSKIRRVVGAKIKIKASTAKITWFDIDKILETLTPEQIEMANELQNFLNNECAAWGNEVSMRMYGYNKFTEDNYFPIKSADVYLDSQFEGRTSIEKIRNFGFTKGTVVNANNPIVIDDIFTVVSDHINKMSMYNGFAAPIADFTRVYNYKVREEDGTISASTKSALQDTYGKKVGSYITKFIADLQSNTQTRTEGFTRLVNKTLANYKKATIAGNLRVALQQPTAICRAFMLISPKYFTKLNPKRNMERMKAHCQVARWKAWGHNQVDMARDIDDIMMNNEWNKLDLFTMQIYGALDNVTWSYIWGAVEKEVQAKHPEVKVDSDEYFELCNDRASEIFDKTQVVDSVLHRSEVMRNTDTMSKMVTSFMAEPTRTYNMVRGQYAKALDQWRDGDKGKATATVAKTTSVFLMNAMLCAMAAAVADALRGKDLDDDDEPEEWLAHVWNNFKGNANPLMMIPVMSEALNYWQGWGSQNMALEGVEALMSSTKALTDKAKGESNKDWGELFRKEAEAIGLVFGVPVKNILRELETFGKLIGWEASAATTMTEEKSVFEKLDDKDLLSIKNGSFLDNTLNHFGWNLTEAEKVERERQQQIKEYEGKLDGLTGADRQEKMWSIVMKGYTTDLKTGNVASIEERRKILEAMGGDIEYFDERVQEKVITAYKKTIGTEDGTSAILKEYLMTEYGYTEGKISTEIICKSDVAKDFQLAMCANNEQEAVDALVVLLNEGITEADIYTLYYNRYKAIDVGDYVTGEMDSPVDGRVTSTFGWRDAPTAGASSYHEGIDIAATAGSVVGAADGGKVSSCGYNKTEGYFVRISHGNGRYTEYKHLEGFCVYKGQPVAAGQEIGRVGSTGVSTGPHLHFSVKESGVYVDPAPYLK